MAAEGRYRNWIPEVVGFATVFATGLSMTGQNCMGHGGRPNIEIFNGIG